MPRQEIQPIILTLRMTNCNKCHNRGNRTRTSKILVKATNADSGGGLETETLMCNTLSRHEVCEQKSAQDSYIFNYYPENETTEAYSYVSANKAMEQCLKEENCCGISHNYSGWTLRKGDIETSEIQIRKDCYEGHYTSIYCKDQNPGTCKALLEVVFNNDQNGFEALYCNTRKTHEINCLKTCRRCL